MPYLPAPDFVVAIPLRSDPQIQVTVPPGCTTVRVSAQADLYWRRGTSETAELPLAPVNDGTASARLQADGEHVRAVTGGEALRFVADVETGDDRFATLEFFA
jgi:hypothetical protein